MRSIFIGWNDKLTCAATTFIPLLTSSKGHKATMNLLSLLLVLNCLPEAASFATTLDKICIYGGLVMHRAF